ncbi:hypothetical protein [Pseudarthrobacter sp. TAF60_1]|uniref:hypothetical protein n=1 Tax=Pseudarthrobacter sp. TAF60_1 TaxID=3233071 RepID=UPI003F98FEE8
MKRSLTCCGFFPDALSLNAGFARTLLLRGALITAVLAIIAGIFGMHVMTGNHAAHGDHTAAVQVAGGHPDAGHDAGHATAGHMAVGHTAAVEIEAVPTIAGSDSCAGSCHSMQESGASCIPSAKAGALTVFPPQESGFVLRAGSGSHTGPTVAYAHTPASPTPCELSISRT